MADGTENKEKKKKKKEEEEEEEKKKKRTLFLCVYSVERITSDIGRYATAQLICVFVVLDLDL